MPLNKMTLSHIYQIIEFLGQDINVCKEDLFAKTGSLTRQNELKALLRIDKKINLSSGLFSVHDCSCVLKSFLAEMPEPLLSEAHYSAHCHITDMSKNGLSMSSSQMKNIFERQLKCIQLLFLFLPADNYCLLKYLLLLLYRIQNSEQKNKMASENLATLFAPHIMCPRKRKTFKKDIFISTGKKRSADFEENQVYSDGSLKKAPKRQCVEVLQTVCSSHDKEKDDTISKCVPYHSVSKTRELAALKKKFLDGDSDTSNMSDQQETSTIKKSPEKKSFEDADKIIQHNLILTQESDIVESSDDVDFAKNCNNFKSDELTRKMFMVSQVKEEKHIEQKSSETLKLEIDVCFKCKKPGHVAKNCFDITEKRRCFKCGNEGHLIKNCDQLTKGKKKKVGYTDEANKLDSSINSECQVLTPISTQNRPLRPIVIDGSNIAREFVVEYAASKGGVMVTNDNYRDLVNVSESFKEAIEQRLLMYCFVGDTFMIPDDPLGRNGPRLKDFLTFPTDCSEKAKNP